MKKGFKTVIIISLLLVSWFLAFRMGFSLSGYGPSQIQMRESKEKCKDLEIGMPLWNAIDKFDTKLNSTITSHSDKLIIYYSGNVVSDSHGISLSFDKNGYGLIDNDCGPPYNYKNEKL